MQILFAIYSLSVAMTAFAMDEQPITPGKITPGKTTPGKSKVQFANEVIIFKPDALFKEDTVQEGLIKFKDKPEHPSSDEHQLALQESLISDKIEARKQGTIKKAEKTTRFIKCIHDGLSGVSEKYIKSLLNPETPLDLISELQSNSLALLGVSIYFFHLDHHEEKLNKKTIIGDLWNNPEFLDEALKKLCPQKKSFPIKNELNLSLEISLEDTLERLKLNKTFFTNLQTARTVFNALSFFLNALSFNYQKTKNLKLAYEYENPEFQEELKEIFKKQEAQALLQSSNEQNLMRDLFQDEDIQTALEDCTQEEASLINQTLKIWEPKYKQALALDILMSEESNLLDPLFKKSGLIEKMKLEGTLFSALIKDFCLAYISVLKIKQQVDFNPNLTIVQLQSFKNILKTCADLPKDFQAEMIEKLPTQQSQNSKTTSKSLSQGHHSTDLSTKDVQNPRTMLPRISFVTSFQEDVLQVIQQIEEKLPKDTNPMANFSMVLFFQGADMNTRVKTTNISEKKVDDLLTLLNIRLGHELKEKLVEGINENLSELISEICEIGDLKLLTKFKEKMQELHNLMENKKTSYPQENNEDVSSSIKKQPVLSTQLLMFEARKHELGWMINSIEEAERKEGERIAKIISDFEDSIKGVKLLLTGNQKKTYDLEDQELEEEIIKAESAGTWLNQIGKENDPSRNIIEDRGKTLSYYNLLQNQRLQLLQNAQKERKRKNSTDEDSAFFNLNEEED